MYHLIFDLIVFINTELVKTEEDLETKEAEVFYEGKYQALNSVKDFIIYKLKEVDNETL